MESDRLGHIDSPEDDISDTTEALHAESLLDDISSVLGHDLLGAIQDNTITEDTTTLCGEKPRRLSSKKKNHTNTSTGPSAIIDSLITRNNSLKEIQLQCGFENMVFEMDNRCDDQKAREPIRYCSLAQFVEGNDIARKSFKVIPLNSTKTMRFAYSISLSYSLLSMSSFSLPSQFFVLRKLDFLLRHSVNLNSSLLVVDVVLCAFYFCTLFYLSILPRKVK